jgi:hypothetical protein
MAATWERALHTSRRSRLRAAVALVLALLATSRGERAWAGEMGDPCASKDECATGFCVDGVCCENACDEVCFGCSPLMGSIGKEGECRPIAQGIDPKDACSADPPLKCQQTGLCDGQGKCAVQPEGTPCGISGECREGACVSVAFCDGDRTILGAVVPIDHCEPFRCSPETNACIAVCATNQDCIPGSACSVDGRCEAPIAAEAADAGCGLRPGQPSLDARIIVIAAAALLWIGARGRARRARP